MLTRRDYLRSLAAAAGTLQSLDAERLEIVRRGALTHVQHERAGMPSAHLLFRGMYDQPREKLAANTPYALPPMSAVLVMMIGPAGAGGVNGT